MRKYQRRQVAALAELYRSKDVLRWVYIASRLGVKRDMSSHERKILIRRMAVDIKKVADALGKALQSIVLTVENAAAALVKAFGGNDLHIDHIAPATTLKGIEHGAIVNTRLVDGSVNNIMGVGNGKS